VIPGIFLNRLWYAALLSFPSRYSLVALVTANLSNKKIPP